MSNRATNYSEKYISENRVAVSLQRQYRDYLKIIFKVMIVYYLFLAISHFLFLATETSLLMTPLAFFTAVGAGVGLWAINKEKVRLRYIHALFVPFGILVLANIYLHVVLLGEQIQLTNGALAGIAFGLVTFSRRVYTILMVLSAGCFVTAIGLVPGDLTGHLTFMMVASFLVGFMAFVQRRNSMLRQIRLTIANQQRAYELTMVNADLNQKKIEAEDAAAKAEKANATKDIFLANTTHELRTPLTGVIGMIELMGQTKLDGEQKRLVDVALSSANTLLSVINDILDFSKLEAGKIAIEPKPFRPNVMLRTIAGMMEQKADEKGISLNAYYFDDDQKTFEGDANRIGQILLNLVGNAIKFTETGKVEVFLRQEVRFDTEYFIMEIADTGVGIPHSELSTLFKRFEQVDNTVARQHGGTGLGLAISQELARLMDGKIVLNTEVGVGTTFTVMLPLKELAPETINSSGFQPDTQGHQLGSDIHVLVAEDNPINQLLVRKILEAEGLQSTLVSNGAELMQKVEEDASQYDVVLMDIQMPVMGGEDAAKAMRKLGGPAAELPIIALTANTMSDDVDRYLSLGMEAVVGKPIDQDMLISTIGRYAKDKSH